MPFRQYFMLISSCLGTETGGRLGTVGLAHAGALNRRRQRQESNGISGFRQISLAAALLSLVLVQTGCTSLMFGGVQTVARPMVEKALPPQASELSIMIQLSPNEPRSPPDGTRLARCTEIEVAIANWAGAVLYGNSPHAGLVDGFVLQDNDVDTASLGRLRDRVGEIFAGHLREAFPDKKVSYRSAGAAFPVPGFDSGGNDEDGAAVCLVSYTYLIHQPRWRSIGGGPIFWAKHHRKGKVAVLELEPPLLLPRAEAFGPETGWAREKAFWRAGCGEGSAEGSPVVSECPLDCTAEVILYDLVPFRPESVRLPEVDLKAAMERWADSHALDLIAQLRVALR
jgi:hypothetical protein